MLITELTKEELKLIVNEVFETQLSELKKELLITNPTDEEYLTREDAAKLLKVSLNSVDTYRRTNKIPSYYIGGSIRLLRSDIHKFLTTKN